MGILALGMVQMQVKDWAAAVQWYSEKLSFQVVVRDEHEFCLLALSDGGCQLALYGVPSVTLGSRSRCIPSLLVEDLSSTLAQLRQSGVSVDREMTADEGYRLATIADPEGNLIHLYEWIRP
jgi:predicted enzyme related to lactoylglutathione lyase